jgi:hypothetical protein
MHCFNHCPTCGIWPMFSKTMFHFQELEKPLKILKICHRAPFLEQMEDCNKLHVFLFFYVLSPFTTCTTTISHSLEACSFSFFTWALEGQRKYCLRITHCLALLHFHTLEYLMRESSFGINNFSFPLMSKHICILSFSFSHLGHILV